MLKVIINGKAAALPLDAEVVLKFKNNLIEDRKDDATYPFTLSLSANRHIFGSLERIANNNFKTEFSAQVMFGPYNLLTGNAVITEINEDQIEIYIATKQKSFWGSTGYSMLNESFHEGEEGWDGSVDPENFMLSFKDSLTMEKFYVACPLYDPTMLTVPGSRGDHEIKQFYINPYIPHYFQISQDNKYSVFCLFPRLYNVIQAVLKKSGYNIGLNYLLKIPDFKNILIINRRHFISKRFTTGECRFNKFVPIINVKDFFEEIERKFGVVFIPDETKKTIDIVSLNDFIKTPVTYLNISDNYQKSILDSDDVETGYQFIDENVDDDYWDSTKKDKVAGSNIDPKQIKCISTPVGIENLTDYGQMAAIKSGDTNTAIELDIEGGSRHTEFRLAIYNGFVNGYPKMTPVGKVLNLDWSSLYPLLHELRTGFLLSRMQTHKLQVADNDSAVLSKIRSLFNGYVVCRGQKYILTDQEIKLSLTKIVDYTVSGNPV